MNRIVIIGRLVRDVEIRHTQTGVAVALFTLAVDRRFKNASGEKEADFIPVVAWKQLGELCATYLSKGKMVAVSGSLQIRSYEDKDKQKRTAAEVVAEDVQFLSPKDGTESSRHSEPSYNDEIPVGDDDLPFN